MAYPNSIDTFRTLKDFAFTFLTSDIASIDTSIPVSDTSNFPDEGYAVINYSEIIYYTSKTSTSLEGVSRGQLGTTAQDFSSGVPVYHTALSQDFLDLQSSIQKTQSKAGLVIDTPPSSPTVGDKYITSSGTPFIYDGSVWKMLLRGNDVYYCNIYYGSLITVGAGTDYYFDKDDPALPTYTEVTLPSGSYVILVTASLHSRSAGTGDSVFAMYSGYYDGTNHVNLTPVGRIIYPNTSNYSSCGNSYITTLNLISSVTISPYVRVNVTDTTDGVYIGGIVASILAIRVGE